MIIKRVFFLLIISIAILFIDAGHKEYILFEGNMYIVLPIDLTSQYHFKEFGTDAGDVHYYNDFANFSCSLFLAIGLIENNHETLDDFCKLKFDEDSFGIWKEIQAGKYIRSKYENRFKFYDYVFENTDKGLIKKYKILGKTNNRFIEMEIHLNNIYLENKFSELQKILDSIVVIY